MNNPAFRKEKAFTLTELLVVIAVVGILALFPLSALALSKSAAHRLTCVSNLKQVGLAFRLWADNHAGRYPMRVSAAQGGPQMSSPVTSFAANPSGNLVNIYRLFQVMSNELNTPKVLYCPMEYDSTVFQATAWSGASGVNLNGNNNLSYFVGVDADPFSPRMLLSGDHNMGNSGTVATDNSRASTTGWGNGTAGLLAPTAGTSTNNPTGAWMDNGHQKQGNVGLSDGSAQQVTISKLREALRNTGDTQLNRLAFP
jgi:prepilin-type N-terminal cleavage/methylation domain-containing protein